MVRKTGLILRTFYDNFEDIYHQNTIKWSFIVTGMPPTQHRPWFILSKHKPKSIPLSCWLENTSNA